MDSEENTKKGESIKDSTEEELFNQSSEDRNLNKDMDNNREKTMQSFRDAGYTPYQRPSKGGKKTLLLIIVLIILLTGVGFILRHQIRGMIGGSKATPSPAPTPEPSVVESTPTPAPLVRSEWSFEVLNGSGVTGLAKTIADKLTALGYSVVKTGNADNSNYQTTQIFVKSDLKDKVDLVIEDLRDTVKIASVGGELKDSTASARIIIGKDIAP